MAIYWPRALQNEYFIDTDDVTDTFYLCGLMLYTSSPCESCDLNDFEAGTKTDPPANYLAFQRTVRNICNSSSYTITVTWDAFSAVGNRFRVSANGVNIFDTGCVTGSGHSTVTIPAGTSQVVIRVDGNCNSTTGIADQWTLQIACP